MPAEQPLKVVLCWHMHQPQYRDMLSGQYQQPWTYLHAIKDYIDMAALIEANSQAKAVVNFAPVLLEQLADYAAQVRGFLDNSVAIRDPLLVALESPSLPSAPEARAGLIKACLRANDRHMVDRFTHYRDLAHLARRLVDVPDAPRYLTEQFLIDLVVWYHLAWLGETVRRGDTRVQGLIDKGHDFTLHDRRVLLQVIGELLGGLTDRYRALAERGQVELSVSPWGHPIVPLLLDLHSAREAMPDVVLPMLPAYPGGEERARWHLREAATTFEQAFGMRPKGCWPSEGGVSAATLRLLAEHGFAWAATGENVLHNSLRQGGPEGGCRHRPYRIDGIDLTCFFRDDGLSDLIGFTYADWHGDDAVNNLIHHLENIAEACRDEPGRLVAIIMDGENAWEHYPENAYHFLTALYRRLADHPGMELTTFSACLEQAAPPAELNQLVAGSWVYGNFATWIGDPDKNRGWDLLGEAKRHFDAAVAAGRLSGDRLAAAERQLAICEGSDWFWWFGDYNAADSVSDFERLYRQHLANLYQMLGEEPPQQLTEVISHGRGQPEHGGAMRRSSQ